MILQIGNLNSFITGSISYQESFSEILNSSKFKTITVSGKKNKLLRILDITSTLIINSNKAKLIIIHSFSTNAFYITVWVSFLCRMFKLKYFILTHGGDYPNRLNNSPKLIKYAFGNAKEIICPSIYLKKHFQDAGYTCKLIPNGVDLKLFPFLDRNKFNPKILWVRSFAQIYNPLMALKVIKLLKEKFPSVSLIMVGGKKDNSYDEVIEYIKTNNLTDNVKLTGILTHSEWAEISKECDLFINTTTIDNMPLSVLQSMLLGLPVFSTNVGGIDSLIEDGITGIKIESGNATEMANKILHYLSNQNELFSIVQSARKIPVKYSWEKVLPMWIELFSNNKITK